MLSCLTWAILIRSCLTVQESNGQARELVERLRSDRIEERTDAEQRLIKLGRKAIPELQKVISDADPEVALRARQVTVAVEGSISLFLQEMVSSGRECSPEDLLRGAGSMSIEELIPYFSRLLEDQEHFSRVAGARGLLILGARKQLAEGLKKIWSRG